MRMLQRVKKLFSSHRHAANPFLVTTGDSQRQASRSPHCVCSRYRRTSVPYYRRRIAIKSGWLKELQIGLEPVDRKLFVQEGLSLHFIATARTSSR
jgi:hypothetical protein